ncbi:MAG: SPASM domain-containing protein, partial [Limisphaerales bacterium]
FKQFLKRLREINWAYAVDYHFYGEPMLHPNLESLVRQTVEASPRAKPRVFTNGDFLTEEKLLGLVKAGVFCFNVSRHPPYRDEWDQRMRHLLDKYSQFVRCNDPALRELSNRGGLVQLKISDQAHMWQKGCHAPSVNLGVSSRGDYLFCCADYLEKNVLGNIFAQSIVEAWQREPFKTHRENARKSNPTLPICKACFGPEPRLETS